MTKEDIANLEQAFGVRLPPDYVAFVTRYPHRLRSLKTDLGWKQESPADRELLGDAEKLRRINELVRIPGTPWTVGDGPWPDHCFFVGDDETGNYWCIDSRSASGHILFYDHDSGTFRKQCDN